MKFICEGLDLSEALLKVSKACATKTTVAILECIKISAYNDVITLTASDGELSIRKTMKAEVLEEGDICVPGKTFTDFVNKLVGVSVTLRTGVSGLEINYGDNSTSLQILPATDFPTINMDINENSFEIENKVFKDMIAGSVFCCAQDDSRPILKGCLMEIEDGKIVETALDGFRMAVLENEIVSGSGKLRMVCPARTLNEIAKMITDDEGTLTVYMQNGMMMVKLEDTTIVSRLYQGEFINYKKILPPEFTTEVLVNKSELCESVERAGIMIRSEKVNLIIFDIKNDGIRITSTSEMGNVLEKVRCTLSGKEMRIAMNSKYIMESLKAIKGDMIKLSFNNSISPFILRNEEDETGFYLILPVRTGN